MESITSNSTRRVTKKELIEAINRTFPDDDVIKDNYVIAVVTEVSCHYNEPTLQSIQFGKSLRFRRKYKMTREECEMLILQHAKEIRDIAKQYDTSDQFYLTMCCINNSIHINNAWWDSNTPISIGQIENGVIIRDDN